jgi:hypothetical protein
MKKDRLESKPKKPPRQDWDEEFGKLQESDDDKLLWPDVLDDDILEEWD